MTEEEIDSLRKIKERAMLGVYAWSVDSVITKYKRAKDVMDDIEKEFNMQCQIYPGYSRVELRRKARVIVMAKRKSERRENDRLRKDKESL